MVRREEQERRAAAAAEALRKRYGLRNPDFEGAKIALSAADCEIPVVSLRQNVRAVANAIQLDMLWRSEIERFRLKQKLRKTAITLDAEARAEAKRLRERVKSLSGYVQEAAGPESVLVPASALRAVGERAERAERERDAALLSLAIMLSVRCAR